MVTRLNFGVRSANTTKPWSEANALNCKQLYTTDDHRRFRLHKIFQGNAKTRSKQPHLFMLAEDANLLTLSEATLTGFRKNRFLRRRGDSKLDEVEIFRTVCYHHVAVCIVGINVCIHVYGNHLPVRHRTLGNNFGYFSKNTLKYNIA